MRKILITVLTIVLFTTAISHENTPAVVEKTEITSEQVIVDALLKPYFIRFVQLMEKNNIKIDYSKIYAIEALPLYDGFHGIYTIDSKVVLVNLYYEVPLSVPLNDVKRVGDEMIFHILAHEIGHSQGLKHKDPKAADLMASSSFKAYWAIDNIGADQYVLDAFNRLN